MQRVPPAALLLAALALSACSKDPSSLVGPSAPSGIAPAGPSGTSGSGPTTPTIQPVDPTVFTPSDTGSAANTGSSTSVLFFSSGTAQYGNGTCGPNGTWTDSLGNVSGTHDSHCVAYWSDSRVGNNVKGQCVTSSQGYPGLWLNPQAHPTAPYHTNCVVLGNTTVTLDLRVGTEGAQLCRRWEHGGPAGVSRHGRRLHHGRRCAVGYRRVSSGLDHRLFANRAQLYDRTHQRRSDRYADHNGHAGDSVPGNGGLLLDYTEAHGRALSLGR